MAQRRLFWKLFPSYLLVTIVSLVLAVVLAAGPIRDSHLGQVTSDLDAKAHLVAQRVSRRLPGREHHTNLENYCRRTGHLIHTRITIIAADGQVLCDSKRSPDTMDNHRDRPEVRLALAGRRGRSIRFSHTLRENMMYVAVPLSDHGRIIAVVRAAQPLGTINAALDHVRRRILAGGLAAVALAALLTFLISRRITKPIEELTRQIENQSGDGTLPSISLTGRPSREFSVLSRALNDAARQMHQRMVTIEQERGKLAAVLESMEEGVLALDRDGRIVMINQAARTLLEIPDAAVAGRFLEELVRSPQLQAMARNALDSGAPSDTELSNMGSKGMTILAHCRIMTDSADGNLQGLLMVLADVTMLRHMERVRRDFVANVSHELKTPITAIKGFSETLLDGALDDPKHARRFCRIIASQADRMETIVADLLTLSSLEGRPPESASEFHPIQVSTLVDAAVLACRPLAEKKDICLETHVDRNLLVSGDARLLEQALINILDNAVKYSDQGGPVIIRARLDAHEGREPEVVLSVEDNGIGIPRKHHARIFERFYRVDKARSRKLGGTGLGLAIVKHIVLLQGGRVEVTSSPGQGSTFSMHLPSVINSSDSHGIFIDS